MWVTKRAKNVGEGEKRKKRLRVKTVALAVKLWWKSLAKVKQPKVARVELRASGGVHRPEKLGWSAGGMEKQPRKTTSTNITKSSWSFSQTKYHRWEFCWVRLRSKLSHQKRTNDSIKNDYRSVINIIFTSNIVLHIIAISIFNKDNGWCRKRIKRWFWWCCW